MKNVVVAQWEEPSQPNGNITEYVMNLKKKKTNKVTKLTTTVSPFSVRTRTLIFMLYIVQESIVLYTKLSPGARFPVVFLFFAKKGFFRFDRFFLASR